MCDDNLSSSFYIYYSDAKLKSASAISNSVFLRILANEWYIFPCARAISHISTQPADFLLEILQTCAFKAVISKLFDYWELIRIEHIQRVLI